MARRVGLVAALLLAGCATTSPQADKADEMTWGKLAMRYATMRADVVRHIDWIREACQKKKLEAGRCAEFERQVTQLGQDDKEFQGLLVKRLDTPGTSGGLVDGATLSRFLELAVMAGKIAAVAGLL